MAVGPKPRACSWKKLKNGIFQECDLVESPSILTWVTSRDLVWPVLFAIPLNPRGCDVNPGVVPLLLFCQTSKECPNPPKNFILKIISVCLIITFFPVEGASDHLKIKAELRFTNKLFTKTQLGTYRRLFTLNYFGTWNQYILDVTSIILLDQT